MATLAIEVKVAWWWPIYIWGTIILATLTDSDLDDEKLTYWVNRAIRIKACARTRAI